MSDQLPVSADGGCPRRDDPPPQARLPGSPSTSPSCAMCWPPGDFWGGSGSVAAREFITQLGRNFQNHLPASQQATAKKVQNRRQHKWRPHRLRPSAAAGPKPPRAAASYCRTSATTQPAWARKGRVTAMDYV